MCFPVGHLGFGCVLLTWSLRDPVCVSVKVMIIITGAHKAFALYKAIEEGVSHMWTVSAFQQHPKATFICDEDATLELRVKTVKYFKGLGSIHDQLVAELGKCFHSHCPCDLEEV